MLEDDRMTQLLLELQTAEAGHDQTLGQAFSLAAVIAVVGTEWRLSDTDAREAIVEWLGTRGEIDSDTEPPMIMIHRESWLDLVNSTLT